MRIIVLFKGFNNYTNRQEDIRRFMFYNASLHYKGNRKIRTVVAYSSDIKKAGKKEKHSFY